MTIWLRLDAHAGPDDLGPHIHETDAIVCAIHVTVDAKASLKQRRTGCRSSTPGEEQTTAEFCLLAIVL